MKHGPWAGLRGLFCKDCYLPDIKERRMHRQRGFRVRMNEKADYPQVIEVMEEVPLPKAERRTPSAGAGDLS